MKSLLIASVLLVLANCHESLDGIIDTFLKEHDGKYGLRDGIGKDFKVGKDSFQFLFTPYGRSHVRRTTPATVTTGANGPVVQWVQEESARNFTGTIWTSFRPICMPKESFIVSGHITMNPVNVSIQFTRQGNLRFQSKVTLAEPLVIKSWSLYQPELELRFHEAISPRMERYITEIRASNLLWANINSGQLHGPAGFAWPEMKRYLQSTQG
ncbi:hypothetical protein HDE_13302 [Halotydeus destructor]|nr:hypothetical protein HDE_13302 [Halotydeus destructor]